MLTLGSKTCWSAQLFIFYQPKVPCKLSKVVEIFSILRRASKLFLFDTWGRKCEVPIYQNKNKNSTFQVDRQRTRLLVWLLLKSWSTFSVPHQLCDLVHDFLSRPCFWFSFSTCHAPGSMVGVDRHAYLGSVPPGIFGTGTPQNILHEAS